MLVIGADTMSRIINYKDRTTCVLFGDGAGAMLLEPAPVTGMGVRASSISSGRSMARAASISRCPPAEAACPRARTLSKQKCITCIRKAQQVFKYAVLKMYEVCYSFAGAQWPYRVRISICWFRIRPTGESSHATAERLGLPMERVMMNIDRYGNTTAGTIPLATRDAIAEGRLKKGDLVMFAAVGAGYTVGASLWRWGF